MQDALGTAYTLQRELGGGGMSRVFVAREESLGRDVVIKLVRPELVEGVSAERFTREVKLAARLQQANIVPVLAAGDAAGTPYYTMPFVRGESLRARLDGGEPVPLATAVGILRDVARALAYAHGEGIVHRDIKPDNVLLSGHTAVVTDFGIAKALAASKAHVTAATGTLTSAGSSLGTPAYMAPEQATGDPSVDHRADLYAWGVVAWELVAGRHPFADRTSAHALIAAHVAQTPLSLSDVRPDVPASLAALVARCLAKEAADRPASADVLLRELEEVAITDPVGRASTVPSRHASSGRRRPLAIVGIALVALATVAGAAFAWRQRDPVIERIAVLPLENGTGDSTQAFFADGMTREIIGVLSDAGVRVLGHRAVAAYRGSTMPMAQIARALNVDALVVGAVLKAGEEVQISAELIDPSSDESLWTRTFTRPAAAVVALQKAVAGDIARGIHARMTAEQERTLAASTPVDPKAYAQYLLGSEQAVLRTPEAFPKAIMHLRRSLALDSSFAPAYAMYAMANAYGLLYALTPTDSGRAAVEWGTARAIALDSAIGDAYIARGVARTHIDWDFTRAEDDYRRGLARNSSTLARGILGWTRWETGRFDEGKTLIDELIALEPTTAQWRSDRGWLTWSSGDSAAARATLLRAIAVDSMFYEAYDLFSMVEADARNFPASRRYHDHAVKLAGNYWVREFSDVVYHMARGDRPSARAVFDSLGRDPRLAQRGFMAYHIGLKDSAYTLLERAVDARDGDLLWVLQAVPYFKPIRSEPRFQALLRRVGLVAGR